MTTILKIIIKGRIPSKKNSRNCFVKNGRMINIPSSKYKEWHNNSSLQLRGHCKITKKIVEVSLHFFMPDNRKCDLTNKAESVMDLLVDNKIIKDDCWQITGNVLLFPMGIDKLNPRCEIDIKEEKI